MYNYLGTLYEKGSTIDDIPEYLISTIYEFIDNIDMEEIDNHISKGEYGVISDDEVYPGISIIVYKDKAIILCRMSALDEKGTKIDDRIITMAIPRDINGNIIKNYKGHTIH